MLTIEELEKEIKHKRSLYNMAMEYYPHLILKRKDLPTIRRELHALEEKYKAMVGIDD